MTLAEPEIFAETGRLWIRNAVPRAELPTLAQFFTGKQLPGKRLSTQFDVFQCASWMRRVKAIWPNHKPVRLIAFDKSASNNWTLPWHQDRVIAVREKHEVPGFTNWSRKGSVWHVEPPLDLVRRMIFLRIHIDASTAENGAMEIVPGSHDHGLIPSPSVSSYAGSHTTEVMEAEPRDILALAMLTLHRSRPSQSTDRRRVLRLDLADFDLPKPLAWTE